MTEHAFRVRKGLTVANTTASANLDPISLIIGSTVVNTTIVSAATVNAATVTTTTFSATTFDASTVNASAFTVGTAWTANSTVVNAAAVNCRGQANTDTLYVATSANVGANVQLTTILLSIGNTTANIIANSTIVKVTNATSTANLTPLALTIGTTVVNSTTVTTGTPVVNSTAVAVGTTIVNSSTLTVGTSVVNSTSVNAAALFKGGSAVATLTTENQALTGGATITEKDLGTMTTGTLTLDIGDCPHQKYNNNGAHTLAPGAVIGSCLLIVTNGATPGAITTSGWTKKAGDAFTTTTAHKFVCHASVTAAGSLLVVQGMQ